MSARPLRREGHPVWARPPARIVHLGLGAFARAHTAWYTQHATDGANWGIVGFTGQSTDLPRRLAAQDGLYTLTTRGPLGDEIEVIPNLVEAHPGSDVTRWCAALAAPTTEMVTLTVTEAAYTPGPTSVAARLVDGLDARRRADAGPVTVIACDNVDDNATVLAGLLRDVAERRDRALTDWVDQSVTVVGSVVDRITPATTDADVVTAARSGWIDTAPVVSEPFTQWALCGTFAQGRPDWGSAGAVFTEDLTPYFQRKLLLLNGAHSLIAYAGLLRGHLTVAEAMNDPAISEMVDHYWDEGTAAVGGDRVELDAYRTALTARFANPRMNHRLSQIAIDGSVKLAQRIVPVARYEREAGRSAQASAGVLGAWVGFVRSVGDGLVDVRSDEIHRASIGSFDDAARRLVGLVSPELADDGGYCAAVTELGEALSAGAAR